MEYNHETISKRLGLEALEPELAEQMLTSFLVALDNRLSLVIASKLNEEQLSRLVTLEEAGDEEAMDALLRGVVPDYETLYDEEAGKLLQEIDDSAAEMLEGM